MTLRKWFWHWGPFQLEQINSVFLQQTLFNVSKEYFKKYFVCTYVRGGHHQSVSHIELVNDWVTLWQGTRNDGVCDKKSFVLVPPTQRSSLKNTPLQFCRKLLRQIWEDLFDHCAIYNHNGGDRRRRGAAEAKSALCCRRKRFTTGTSLFTIHIISIVILIMIIRGPLSITSSIIVVTHRNHRVQSHQEHLLRLDRHDHYVYDHLMTFITVSIIIITMINRARWEIKNQN